MRVQVLSAALCLVGSLAWAQGEPAVERGRSLARTHCARCHAIGPSGSSPLAAAPAFRTLHERYPVEDLEEAFAEGIVTAHPSMPVFRFAPAQAADLIAYLKSLERGGPPPRRGRSGLRRSG